MLDTRLALWAVWAPFGEPKKRGGSIETPAFASTAYGPDDPASWDLVSALAARLA